MGTLQGSQVSSVSRHKTSNVPNAKAKGQFCQINSVLACPQLPDLKQEVQLGHADGIRARCWNCYYFFFFVKAYTWIELN